MGWEQVRFLAITTRDPSRSIRCNSPVQSPSHGFSTTPLLMDTLCVREKVVMHQIRRRRRYFCLARIQRDVIPSYHSYRRDLCCSKRVQDHDVHMRISELRGTRLSEQQKCLCSISYFLPFVFVTHVD